MTANIRVTSTGVDLLARQFRGAREEVARLGGEGKKTAERLGQVSSIAKGVYAAIGGFGLKAAVEKIFEFNDLLSDIQVNGRLGREELGALEKAIVSASDATNRLPSELAQAVREFQKLGGEAKDAQALLTDMGLDMKAFKAPPAEVAALNKVLRDEMGLTKEQAKDAKGLLFAQGRLGEYKFPEHMGTYAEALERAQARGWTGMKGVRQVGGLFQMAAESGSGGEDALALIGTLGKKAKQLQASGIKVFDKKGQMRDIPDIMLEILRRARGNRAILTSIFGRGGAEAALAFANAYDGKTKTWKQGSNVQKFFGAEGGAKDIDEILEARSSGPNKARDRWNKAKKEIERRVIEYGAPALDMLASHPGAAAGLLGGGYVALKYRKQLGQLFGAGGGGAASSALGAATVVPVRVTNWPGSMGGGGGMPSGSRELDLEGTAGPRSRRRGLGFWGRAGAASVGIGLGLGIAEVVDQIDRSALRRPAAERAARTEQSRSAVQDVLLAQAKGLISSGSLTKAVPAAGGGWATKSVPLTPTALMEELTRTASKHGPEGLKELAAIADRIEQLVRDGFKVEVKLPAGIDKATAEVSRGKRR